jgi:hypothetical protein
MAKKKPAKKKKNLTWGCPNPGRAFTLWPLVAMLEQPQSDFAAFFYPKLKEAMNGDPGAITCINSYLAPTDTDLTGLGIPASQVESYKRCTDSGVLMLIVAKEHA